MRYDYLKIIKSSSCFIKEELYLWMGNGFAEILYTSSPCKNKHHKSNFYDWNTAFKKNLTSNSLSFGEINENQIFCATIHQISYQCIDGKNIFSFTIKPDEEPQIIRLVGELNEKQSFCVYDSPEYELFNY